MIYDKNKLIDIGNSLFSPVSSMHQIKTEGRNIFVSAKEKNVTDIENNTFIDGGALI